MASLTGCPVSAVSFLGPLLRPGRCGPVFVTVYTWSRALVTSRLGRKTEVLVFSSYVLPPRRGTSGSQPVCWQGAGGRSTDDHLAVPGGTRGAARLARYGEVGSRGRHRAGVARWGACCGGRWRRDGSRGGGGV